MVRTQKQREHYKRWRRRHPENAIYRLRVWIEKEKNPKKLIMAKIHLKRYLGRERQKVQLNQE